MGRINTVIFTYYKISRLEAEVFERRQTTETTKFLCLQTPIIFKVKKLMVAHSITVSSEQLFDITDLGKSVQLWNNIIVMSYKKCEICCSHWWYWRWCGWKMAVRTLNSSKDECNSNDDNFTYCTAIGLNICEFEPQIMQTFFLIYSIQTLGASYGLEYTVLYGIGF